MKAAVLENDAGGFIGQVAACANGVVRVLNPGEFILVRINNWFGPKWLPFSLRRRFKFSHYRVHLALAQLAILAIALEFAAKERFLRYGY